MIGTSKLLNYFLFSNYANLFGTLLLVDVMLATVCSHVNVLEFNHTVCAQNCRNGGASESRDIIHFPP